MCWLASYLASLRKRGKQMAEIPKDGLSKEILEKMYNEVINVSYDTAEQNQKNKGIMLYEAEKILDVMKKYLFNERV